MTTISRLSFVFAATSALITASQAFAQTRAWEGCIFPMQFGRQGERHYYMYGYNGPLVPPLAPENDKNGVHRKRVPPFRSAERSTLQCAYPSDACGR